MHTNHVKTVLGALCALMIVLANAGTLDAQVTASIRGQVVDAVTQRPLSGAQVSVTGTRLGALSNASGNFLVLNVPVGEQTVRAQLLGYATSEESVTVIAGQLTVLNIAMGQRAIALDELVVTGTAGATERRAVGNSVSRFQATDVVDNVPVTDVQELLQARTPGLSIISNGGGAGDGSQIRLRGSGSVEGRFEPVFYVDGIRIESGNLQGGECGSIRHCTNGIDFLNPEDIESIEVIKGPAAATLYGADAAAGVIQIFTKKGRAGQGIQWTSSLSMGRTDWSLDTPTTYWLCDDTSLASPNTLPGCQQFDSSEPLSARLLTDDPIGRHPGALRNADEWGLNLSARGGGDLFNYFISAERSDDEGIFLNNFARRTGGRANFGFTPSDEFNFNVNMGYSRSHVRQPLSNNSSNSITRNGYRGRARAAADPWEPGFRGLGPDQSNLYNLQTRGERFTFGATVKYDPTDWFRNRLTIGLDNNSRNVTEFFEIDTTGGQPFGATNAAGRIEIELPETHTWTVDYVGTLSTDVGQHYSSSFSSGVQLNVRQFSLLEAIGEGLVANQLNLVGSAATTFGSQDFEEQTSLGFFVQEQVGWKNRLFVTGAVRIDDNSAFGQDFSLVVYPKAQLSYVISEEDYFNVGWVDDLKLRGAWGQAGNPPDPFVADRTFEADVTTVGDISVNTLTPSSFGNSELKAETGSELELGFEASLFDGRVGVDFTFYDQTTRDALIQVPDPPSSGFNGVHFENVGEISNRGIEALVTVTPVYRRNFQWDASVTLATTDNELRSFNGARDEIAFGSFATVQKHIEGFALGGYWGLDVQRDASGQPILDANGRALVEDDTEFVGPSLPTREIGFTNTFTLFGNLRVYANLDYKGGHYQWCAICSIRSRFDLNTFALNDPNGDPAEQAVLRSNQTLSHIKQADFVKLRELSLTYSLGALAQSFGADQASVTVSGRNLWLWTRYDDGNNNGSPDPEVNFNSLSRFNRTDYSSIPQTRTLAVRVRLTY